ncbi:ABC transporter substrate-binding protein [Streptomyces sp. SID13031]|uniref:ABC transporter substrate-binding protein n=1 Tax=Streptomyces sp. SID13031 TaxID=2706046 RepID=UPI0013C8EB96|nr:ABC transporter substrate-binding protein [Streptomyces sp. SID13031]NEA30654.1 ABC transporter substrate-binding protein [Streptomyces sp. SID13031]
MAAGNWSFEDDLGHHVEVANRPARVLAYAQAAQTLVRLGVPVVGYFGSQHHADAGAQPALAGLDVPSVGSGDAVDHDLIRTLQPDLLVGVSYAGEVYGLSETVAAELAGIAPVLLIRIAGEPALEAIIGRFHQLAGALTDASAVPDDETALTSALARLTAAVNEQPAVRVTALSGGTPTDAYVANPAYWPGLRLLAEAGLPFTPTTAKGGWEVVKWTNLTSSHPADILLYDQRPNSLGDDQLATIPAWAEIPAVRAGQVLPWNPEPPLTFETTAASVDTLTTAITALKP